VKTFYGVSLSWQTDDTTLEVRLHRGPCNEIGTTTLRELEQLAGYVKDGADGARALILHSDRPGGFCAGADLRELYEGMRFLQTAGVGQILKQVVSDDMRRDGAVGAAIGMASSVFRAGSRRITGPMIAARVRGFIDRIHAVFDTLDTAPITTIAAVHGVCFGGGFELALTADQIIADRTARFAFPELRLGIVPGFGGIPRLEREVGNAVTRDLLLTGRSLNARRAHELGLIAQVVAPGEALVAARAAAKQAARFEPAAVARLKAFAKPLPRQRLDEEKELFLSMIREPAVEAALARFVTSDDVRPYLP
jgi:enoyl-CoA hydratase/carnithine racemase